MYGTQAFQHYRTSSSLFENDVKMYGTQATKPGTNTDVVFENDVKMYGTQARSIKFVSHNDV